MEAANDAACWTNDNIGIKKEIDLGEHPGNLTLRKAVNDGMAINDAIQYVNKIERQRITDYVNYKQELLNTYPDDEHLRGYLRCLEIFTDGCHYLYLNAHRYGGLKNHTFVKVYQNELD